MEMRISIRLEGRAFVALVMAATGALLLGTAPVSAAGGTSNGLTAAQRAAAKRVTHPERDWAGSQIAKHTRSAKRPTTADHMLIQPFATQTPGLDVSGWQGNVDWGSVAANGAKFAYVKATESTNYTSPYFAQQYNGSYSAGIIRGAYHFATPDTAGGAAQADFFVNHGGGWSGDGRTLPGMLDMEWNPYGSACYGYSASGMVNWILAFSDEYHARTSRWPVIYTATSWWSQCTGNLGDFSSTNPLMVACYCSSPGTMPYNWPWQTIWQWSDRGTFPGDQDYFNGDISRVQALANG
jgi:GH25 family lysozyme M1 (1,4-beta-N-acetylmuramidase)